MVRLNMVDTKITTIVSLQVHIWYGLTNQQYWHSSCHLQWVGVGERGKKGDGEKERGREWNTMDGRKVTKAQAKKFLMNKY